MNKIKTKGELFAFCRTSYFTVRRRLQQTKRCLLVAGVFLIQQRISATDCTTAALALRLWQRAATPLRRNRGLVIGALLFATLAFVIPQRAYSATATKHLSPRECRGWSNPERAQKIDLAGDAAEEDFSAEISATYRFAPAREGSLGVETPSTSLTCLTFEGGLPKNHVLETAAAAVSFGAATDQENAGVVIMELSIDDGRSWRSIGAVPVGQKTSNATHGGYWRFLLPSGMTIDDLGHTEVRARFAASDEFAGVELFFDGITLETTFRKSKGKPFLERLFGIADQPTIIVDRETLDAVEFLDADGRPIDVPYVTEVVDGKTRIRLERGGLLQPGTYVVRTKHKGFLRTVTEEQSFQYGVANLNTSKAVYEPGDLVSVAMGVLDDQGKTVCDAPLSLRITKPDGSMSLLSTLDTSILGSPACGPASLTNLPDYSATFIAEQQGTYQTVLEIGSGEETRVVEGQFEVQPVIPFQIERLAPTRINPKASYLTRLRITPAADFTGRVEESVPKGFSVDQLNPLATVAEGEATQTIAWEVVWEKGKTYELSYAFNAPDISPAFFTIGPLAIGDYVEPKPWTISSDEVVRKEKADRAYEALQVTDEDFAPKKDELVETTKQAFTADENAQIKVFEKGYDVPDAETPGTLPKDEPLSVTNIEVTGPNPEADKGIARVSETFEKNGRQVEFIHLVPTQKFRQGVYTISITYSAGSDSVVETKTFAWGVLVINTPKSAYHPGEQVQFGMGLVNEGGHTLCDAPLTLMVTPPGGEAPVTFTTEDGSIQFSEECGPTTVTNVPDYGATYTAGAAGDYALALTGTIQGVPYTIHDTLSVRDSIPFALTRDAPTRLFPGANYDLSLTVIPEQDYQGDVIEYIPATYGVVSVGQGGNAEPVDDDKQRISWTVDWQTGTTNVLTYTFDPEDISPALFRLGPATIGDFAEYRQWMIASDAVCTAFATGNWSAAGTWTGGGCTGAGGIPGTADTVVIPTSVIVTVDTGNPSVVSLTLNSPSGGANGVTIATGQTLTLTGSGTALSYTANATANAQTITMQGTGNLTVSTGNVVVNAPSAKGNSLVTCDAFANGTFSIAGTLGITGNSSNTGLASFDMLTCRLTVTGLTTLTGGTDATGKARITASTGTVDTNGGLTFAGTAGNALFSTSGITTWNNVGTISGGSAASFSFTARTLLKTTGTSAINTAYTSLPDVEVVSGTTTLGAAQTVTGLMVDSGATLAGSTFLLTNTCTGTGTAGFRIDGTLSGSGGVTLSGSGCTIDAQGAGAKLVSNTGTFTLTNNKTIASTANLTVGSGTSASAISASTTVTNNGTFTFAGTGAVTGGHATTTIWTNAASSTLNIASGTTTFLATGVLTATANGNTVNYNGAAQTCKVTSYWHLQLNGSGAKTCAPTSPIAGNVTVGGTATWTQTATESISGNLTISGGTLTTAAFAFTVTGTTSISSGTLTLDNNTGSKTLTGLATTTGGTLNGSSTAIVLGAGVTNTTGTVQLYGNVTMSTLNGALTATNPIEIITLFVDTASAFSFSGAGGLLVWGSFWITSPAVVTNTGLVELRSNLNGTGNFTNGAGGTLKIKFDAAPTITTLTATASPNTVDYMRAGTQTVRAITYHHLTLSGSGAKTLTSLATINGDFTLSGTASATLVSAVTVGGNLLVGDGASAASLTTGAFTFGVTGNVTIANSSSLIGNASTVLSVGGNWLRNATGVFTHNSAAVKFTSTSGTKTIDTGGSNFYNVTFDGSGGTWNPTTNSMTVANDLTMTNGLLQGSGALNITVNGHVACGATCGTITTSNGTGTFTQSVAADKNFGTSVAADTTNWSFYNLTFTASPASIITTSTTPTSPGTVTVTALLTISVNTTLNVGNRTWVLSGNAGTTLTLTGTLSGTGRLTYQNSATTFPTTGTLANTLITRFDTVNGNMVIPARTDYGAIEAYGGSANARTVTLGTAGSQTITTSSYLYVIADAASPNHVTLQGATWDPTLNIGGDFDFTGTGSANEIVTAPDAAATWTVSGNVNFTDGTYTKSAETLVMDAGIAKTLTSAGQTLNNLTLSGSIILANATHTVAGNLSMAGGVITAGTSTVTMSGTSNTIIGGGNTLANLTIDPASAGTITAQTSDFTVSGTLSVATDDTLSIASGITITWTGSSFTLDGTISGAGRLTINSATVIPTGGTLSSIVRFDLTSGLTTTAPARTYGGDVEAFSSSNTASYLLIVGAGTHTISGSLLVLANGTGGVTYDGTFNNPTVTVAGNVDFTGTGSGTEGIATGTGTWTVTGNVDFTDGGLTASTGNVFLMDGTANLIGSGQSFYDLTVNGNGNTVTVTTSDVTVTNTLTLGAAADVNNDTLTIASGRTLTLSGNAGTTLNITNSGTDTINGPGKLTYRNSAATFPTVGTLAAALIVRFDTVNGAMIIPARTDYGAIEAYGGSANARTLTLAAGTITLSSYLYVIADAASPNNVTLAGATNNPTVNVGGDLDFTGSGTASEAITSGTGTWTVSGNADFTDGTYTATSSTTLTMDGTSKTLTTASNSLYNFSESGGSVTIADTATVSNNLTISGGTLTAPSSLTIGGSFDNDAAFTHNSGTVTFNASTGTKTIDADGTGSDAFNHLVFNDSAGTAVFQLTANMDVNGNFTITGGEVQPQSNTINLAGNWSNSDLFTEGSSTVVFDATSGSQTVTTNNTVTNGGGSAVTETTGRGFYHVTDSITGGGEVILAASSDLSVDGTFTMSSGSLFDIGSNDNKIIVKGDLDLSAVADSAFDARESTYSDFPQIQLWGAATQKVKIQNTGSQTFDSIQFGDIGQATQTRYLSTGVTSGTLNFQDYFIILSGTVDTKDGANANVAVTGLGAGAELYVGDTFGEDSASPKVFNANGSTITVVRLILTDGESATNVSTFNAMTATISASDQIRVGDTASATQTYNTFDASTTSTATISANRVEAQVGTITLGLSRPWDIGRASAQGYGIRVYAAGTWDGATNSSNSAITVAGDFIVDAGGTFSAGSTTITLDGAAATAQKIDPDGDITFNNLALDDSGNRTVTIADVDTSGRRITVSGTFTWDGTVAANAVDVQIGSTTFTAILDLTNATAANSSVVIPTGRTLTMITTSSIELSGNWTNNGTFTRATSTVTAEGSNQQSFSGTMTGASQFYNLTITNSSGSDPESSPSLIFAAAATVENNFTATTANTKLRFNAGSTFTFQNISFNGQATGTRVFLRSSTQGTQWNLNVAGTRSVSNTNVRDSNACGQAPDIDASDGTNLDAGNNSCWEVNTITFSISDTTIGFGALSSATGRWATGDTTGTNASAGSTPTAAHTMTIVTNAREGYAVTYNGATLTSGANTIDVASVDEDSDGTPGSEQFGLSVSTDGNATIASGYQRDSAADFTWVASTTTTIVSETTSTATETISASYLGNISSTTEAGTYSTTVTYIASGTF